MSSSCNLRAGTAANTYLSHKRISEEDFATSTEQSVPVISQKIFSYFFPCKFVPVPHLEVECFPKTSLSTGTVAPEGKNTNNSGKLTVLSIVDSVIKPEGLRCST